jgi:hypothetical protein
LVEEVWKPSLVEEVRNPSLVEEVRNPSPVEEVRNPSLVEEVRKHSPVEEVAQRPSRNHRRRAGPRIGRRVSRRAQSALLNHRGGAEGPLRPPERDTWVMLWLTNVTPRS